MATEEVSKPPSHPTYPEMIMAAIEALDEKGGSNKSAIARHIASTYQDLSESHASLLTAHLARMKESGELLFVKNNYVRPGPDAPPKRGRGRPPKPKPDLPPGETAAPRPPPRPRGRPPKPKDPVAVAVAKATSGMPRRRGRPPKKVARSAATEAGSSTAPATAGGGVKRGRGRPPKVKPVVASDDAVGLFGEDEDGSISPPMAITSGEDGSSIPEDSGRSSSSSAGFLAGQPPLPPGHTKWPTEKSTARDPADAKVPSLRLLLAACQKEVNLVSEKINLFEKQKSEEFGLQQYSVRPLPPGSGSN
ncbi:hypothetical protein MUK42_20492 [Musa troglodytarum]|uniref:HMG-Y-related protein A n=1 Tax=Musa troglodytarum TaxID=320322 RepID=A0A9E7FZ89_9LILI|nr:hypothetical protein MUK42_20492 [Musa troglodytarum]